LQPENTQKRTFIAPRPDLDTIEIEKREILCSNIENLQKFLSAYFDSSNNDLVYDYYYYLILIKAYFDRIDETKIPEIFSSFYSFNHQLNEFLSSFPLLTKNKELPVIDEEFFKKVSPILINIDFSNITFTENTSDHIEISPDYNIERSIFGTFFEVKGIYNTILESLQITDNDIFLIDSFDIHLFRKIFLEENQYNKIFVVNHNSGFSIIHFLIYSLLYQTIPNQKMFDNIFTEEGLNKDTYKKCTIFLLQNDDQFSDFLHDTNSRSRGFIRNLSNFYLPNKKVEDLLSNFYLLLNVEYPFYNNNRLNYFNGLFFQKQFLFKKKIISVLQSYLSKISDTKSAFEKQKMISMIVKPDNIYFDNLSTNRGFLRTKIYSAGFSDDAFNSKKFSINILNNSSIDAIKRSLNDLLMDNLETEENQEQHSAMDFSSGSAKDQNGSYYSESNPEINIILKSTILKNGILHPSYYKKYYLLVKNNIFGDNFIELNKVCNTFIGNDLEGEIPYHDDLILDKSNYIAIVSSSCIRSSNFIDITKVKLMIRTELKPDEVVTVKANDVILAFNSYRDNDLSASLSIIPSILEGSILGKNILLFRPISERILPVQIAAYLNILVESGLIKQILYFINQDNSSNKTRNRF
jgi:hypothetical protein